MQENKASIMSANISSNPKTLSALASNNQSLKPPTVQTFEDICLAGITPFTTIDFPGRLAAVFFLQGCSWRCGYCHNSHLWPKPRGQAAISWDQAFDFLKSRKGLLDGVVFSGGEPTEYERLPALLARMREEGFFTALHTSGIRPGVLKRCLPFCDWVGVDVKAPAHLYDKITRIPGSMAVVPKSIRTILESGVDYECRVTYHPSLFGEKELLIMAKELSDLGIKRFALQVLRPKSCADTKLRELTVPQPPISEEMNKKLKKLFPDFFIRL